MSVASPQIMKLMIGFVEDYASSKHCFNTTGPNETYYCELDSNIQEWHGYLYAAILLCVTMFQTILLSQYFERMFIIGMNLRTSLISAIYRKSLRMSGAARYTIIFVFNMAEFP